MLAITKCAEIQIPILFNCHTLAESFMTSSVTIYECYLLNTQGMVLDLV